MPDFFRKDQVAARYNICRRTVDRTRTNRKLPPPEHPVGDNLPLWRGAVLDAWDGFDDATRAELTREGLGLTDREFIKAILAAAAVASEPQPQAHVRHRQRKQPQPQARPAREARN